MVLFAPAPTCARPAHIARRECAEYPQNVETDDRKAASLIDVRQKADDSERCSRHGNSSTGKPTQVPAHSHGSGRAAAAAWAVMMISSTLAWSIVSSPRTSASRKRAWIRRIVTVSHGVGRRSIP